MLKQTMAAKEETVQKYIESIIGTIGEKIELRRFELLTKGDNDVFGTYTHQGGLIGALTVLEGSQDEAVAKDIAMHIAAVNPTYVSKEDVDEDEVNRSEEHTSELQSRGHLVCRLLLEKKKKTKRRRKREQQEKNRSTKIV